MNNRLLMWELGILAFVLSTFMVFSRVAVPRQKSIYGVWKGEHHGKELLFRFSSDRTCILSFKDNTSGKIAILNGNFQLSFSKKPIPLTVSNIPQLDHPLHTIVKFIGDDSIRIAHFATRWRLRPISFSRDASMNLRRTYENM